MCPKETTITTAHPWEVRLWCISSVLKVYGPKPTAGYYTLSVPAAYWIEDSRVYSQNNLQTT